MKGAPGNRRDKARSTKASRRAAEKLRSGRLETMAAKGSALFGRSKASPCRTAMDGNRARKALANCASTSIAVIRAGEKPRASKASVTTPVPGPSSRTGPSPDGSASAAMARARIAPEGAMAPTLAGLAANRPRKRKRSRSDAGITPSRRWSRIPSPCPGSLRNAGAWRVRWPSRIRAAIPSATCSV